jgi:hypothetical protein
MTYKTSIAEPVEEHTEDYSFANGEVGVTSIFIACPKRDKHDAARYHEAVGYEE